MLVTYAQDNTPHINNTVIDFSKTEKNVKPVVSLTSVLPTEVMINTGFDLEFTITDVNNDPLAYELYFIYRSNQTLLSQGTVENGKVTHKWENTFSIESSNLYFKIVVNDTKDTTIFETAKFNIIETCNHTWVNATCTTPKTCTKCGQTEGSSLGHDLDMATCQHAATCKVCGHTEGELGNHSWVEATKEAPKTCTICGITEGEPLKGCGCKKSALIGIISSIAIAGILLFVRRRGR